MIDCCQLCYAKYIKTDGEIDQKRIKAAAKVQAKGDKKVAEAILKEPCRCECHHDGINVIH
jgi:hypothetical protein